MYAASGDDMVNPERGFYIPLGTSSSRFVPLQAESLRVFRQQPQQVGKASYRVQVSLLYRGYELDSFRDKPLSQPFLTALQADFDAVRQAGLKMILRFAYTNTAKGGNCNDEYKICPPYGDAPPVVVFRHIEQLKPLLQENADVIAVMQEGFIGIWGENYFTDYFGDASTNGAGRVLDSGWALRNELLKRLLDALPQNRMVQVRTPQIKQKFVYGPSAPAESNPLNEEEASKNQNAARIGFHNDCFLASPDDYGTFYDYGSSTQPRRAANETLRRYFEADSKYTVVSGETCDDAFSPQNDCAPAGKAEAEMKAMHYTYLNAAYNNDVNNDWDSAGCLYNIRRHLGYRLVLQWAKLPLQAKKGAPFSLQMAIDNLGYAAPFNPRSVYLVLRNTETQAETKLALQADVRKWHSGSHRLREKVLLPASLPSGKYELFLSLPDADEQLVKRPEYSIMLANKSIWEATTGYNKLLHTLTIQ